MQAIRAFKETKEKIMGIKLASHVTDILLNIHQILE